VIKSLKDTLRAKFNVSITELGLNDKWQSADMGVAACSNDGRFLDQVLSKVVDSIRVFPGVEMVNYELEIY